jgi:hypothetical protein
VPAKDHYHDTVKRALIKDGWMIVQEQVYLSDNQRHVWVDLSARRELGEALILIEIKGFEGNSSLIDALMSALGQYAVYKAMLDYLNLKEQLFLAVPRVAYEGIFQAPVAQQAIQNLAVRLLVFDPIAEEVVLWVP